MNLITTLILGQRQCTDYDPVANKTIFSLWNGVRIFIGDQSTVTVTDFLKGHYVIEIKNGVVRVSFDSGIVVTIPEKTVEIPSKYTMQVISRSLTSWLAREFPREIDDHLPLLSKDGFVWWNEHVVPWDTFVQEYVTNALFHDNAKERM